MELLEGEGCSHSCDREGESVSQSRQSHFHSMGATCRREPPSLTKLSGLDEFDDRIDAAV
jgi:hypothetical protein